jgi:hypothetical protein
MQILRFCMAKCITITKAEEPTIRCHYERVAKACSHFYDSPSRHWVLKCHDKRRHSSVIIVTMSQAPSITFAKTPQYSTSRSTKTVARASHNNRNFNAAQTPD